MADRSISTGAEFVMEFRDDASAEARKSIKDLNKILRDTVPEQERFAKADENIARMEQLLAEKVAAGTISIQHANAAINEMIALHPRQAKAAKEAADAAEQAAKQQAEAAKKLAEEQKDAARQAAIAQKEEARRAAEAQRAEMIRIQRESAQQAKAMAIAQRNADREARAAQIQAARELAAQQKAIAKQASDEQRAAMQAMAQQNQAVLAQMKAGQGDLRAAAGQIPLFGRFAGVMGPATAGLAAFGVAATVVRAEMELVGKAVGFASDNIKTAYEALDDAADAAEDLGIKANALRMLQVQAELAEVSTETLRNSLKKMMVNLGEAADDPSGGASKLFSKLRLDATELANQRPGKAFERIMTAIEDLPTRAQQLNAINDIFGRGNTEIIRLIGSYELFRDKAKQLAVTLTDDQDAAQKEAQASMIELQIATEELWKQVAVEVIPAVGKLSNELVKLTENKDFRDAFVSTFVNVAHIIDGIASNIGVVATHASSIQKSLSDNRIVAAPLAQLLGGPLSAPLVTAANALLPSSNDIAEYRRTQLLDQQIQKLKDRRREEEGLTETIRKRGDVELSVIATQPTLGGGALSLFDGVGDRIKKMIDDQDKFLSQIREQNELIGKTREEQEQIKLGRITALTGAMEALKVVQDERAEKEKIVELEKEAAKLKKDQENEAERLRRSLMTRDEVAQENIAKWRELARTGLISDVELQKAIGRELGGLSSGKPAEVPSTLKAGTAEAMRAVFYRQQSKTEDLLGQIARNTKPDPAKQKIELVAEGM